MSSGGLGVFVDVAVWIPGGVGVRVGLGVGAGGLHLPAWPAT